MPDSIKSATSTTSCNPVFIGHGSPMNAISTNKYSTFLTRYAASIPKPKALVVISAHWQTEGSYITGNNNPRQLYDFYGFPEAIYALKYAPPGSSAIATLIRSAVGDIRIDPDRGIDHAAWAVVRHLYPDQSVPLLELSLDIRKTARQHFRLGQELGRLASEGILFVGSGNLVHNLREISFDETETPYPWARAADDWLRDKIFNMRIDELVEYEKHFPDFARSIPTSEHYLPLLYILGMHDKSRPIRTLFEEIQNGSISMRSIEVSCRG